MNDESHYLDDAAEESIGGCWDRQVEAQLNDISDSYNDMKWTGGREYRRKEEISSICTTVRAKFTVEDGYVKKTYGY